MTSKGYEDSLGGPKGGSPWPLLGEWQTILDHLNHPVGKKLKGYAENRLMNLDKSEVMTIAANSTRVVETLRIAFR